jgi:hypothetical protein
VSKIDRIVFGDNQFFGINHMSQDKARALAERFTNLDNIFAVYRNAYDAGIRAIMLNSNDGATAICDRFRAQERDFDGLAWYPSIPYPYKYANMVAEKGIAGALNEILFQRGSAMSGIGKLVQGGLALASLDAIKLMKMLIDAEMQTFRGLNVKVIFLQNIVTDLLLGLDTREIFEEYCAYIGQKYGALPGLITQNMPHLRAKLIGWNIPGVVICSSINQIGYLMSPGISAYEQALAENDGTKYPMMAMSTLASGALRAPEAYGYINKLNLQSVVFGASSRGNIEESARLIRGS